MDSVLRSTTDKGLLIEVLVLVFEGFLFWFLTVGIENDWFTRTRERFFQKCSKFGSTNKVGVSFRKLTFPFFSFQSAVLISKLGFSQNFRSTFKMSCLKCSSKTPTLLQKKNL